MAELFTLHDEPSLHEPVLVLGLDGWIDAGFGAAGATAHLLEVLDTEVVATFDTDALVDHRSRRPVMHLEEGVNTGLTWPSTELRHALDLDGNDLLLLTGAEPDVRWRGFAAAVVDLAQRFGSRLVVGFGAYPAPVPHTRPGRLATTATSSELAQRAGQVRATLDVPAGAQAAIEERCADGGLPAVGLWAQVPHYASGMAYPLASAMLVDGLAEVGGLRIDSTALHEAGALLRNRLDELVSENPEHLEMVRRLEAALDAEHDARPGLGTPGEMPSGDELAAELEQFLRDRGPGREG
ncbi:MAG TPA: PAC2 family protein [Acidimicrobiales bacterium]|nr:PAC2 family protein [Acidimicrobiales bacterium]